MKKHIVDLVRTYVRKLSEDDLHYLNHKLRDRMGGDVAEAVRFLEKNPEIDRWFSTSRSANDLYDMVDVVHQFLEQDSRLSGPVARAGRS